MHSSIKPLEPLTICTATLSTNSKIMDPLSLISLTGNLVQFVEISTKLVAEARYAYKTGVGNTTRMEALLRQIETLQATAVRASTVGADTPGTSDEIALGELSSRTKNLVREVTELSNRLQMRKPKSRINSAFVALKAQLKEGDITRLEQHISECRADIVERWTMMTRSVEYVSHTYRCLWQQ